MEQLERNTRGFQLATRRIALTEPTFVIAEAGVNHNGDLNVARKLIEVAHAAGADAVKFQTFTADDLVTADTPRAAYQERNTGSGASQQEMLRALELPFEAFRILKEHADAQGIVFLSTPHTEEAVRALAPLVSAFKIGSADLTNRLLLEEVAAHGKPMMLATGMADLTEVERALGWLRATGLRDIVMMHCTSSYPCRFEDVNLDAMLTMRRTLDCLVGYSDHTLGIQVPIMAATLGAVVIEKHFTLDRTMAGPDHAASLLPDEFAEMVRAVKQVARIRGEGRKNPVPAELANLPLVRKSLAARTALAAGTVLRREHLMTKRPATGIPPHEYAELLGRKTRRSIAQGALLAREDLA
ncbi:MAG: N-acetylneuraminate synthase [Planctomycetota bacterium]